MKMAKSGENDQLGSAFYFQSWRVVMQSLPCCIVSFGFSSEMSAKKTPKYTTKMENIMIKNDSQKKLEKGIDVGQWAVVRTQTCQTWTSGWGSKAANWEAPQWGTAGTSSRDVIDYIKAKPASTQLRIPSRLIFWKSGGHWNRVLF